MNDLMGDTGNGKFYEILSYSVPQCSLMETKSDNSNSIISEI